MQKSIPTHRPTNLPTNRCVPASVTQPSTLSLPANLPPSLSANPQWVTTRHPSPLGTVLIAATDKGVAGLWFEGQKYAPDGSQWPSHPDHPLLRQATAMLDGYFDGHTARLWTEAMPLDLSAGTPFQQRVWRALLAIPLGQVTTYGELSTAMGKPQSVRAVAAAIGKNPISIVVPCHRVIGKDGSLVGYAGGLARKAHLLGLEKAPVQFDLPTI